MKQCIKVTFSNVSIGYECIRVYDSRNEAMIKTNELILSHMRKYNTDEIFVRYESHTDGIVDRYSQDLPF